MFQNYHNLYNESFYLGDLKSLFYSAETILSLLFQHYLPESVIDIGCGQGGWLAVAESLGVKKLKGFDGAWVNQDKLFSSNIDFEIINFEESMPSVSKKYDLCISLEVVEHISAARAYRFVQSLCQASDIILFGAAIPHQGGVNHINEQWQSYWINLFQANGYQCIDLFRGKIWHDPSIFWWYRQNTFLFIGPQNTFLHVDTLKLFEKPIYDIPHPENYVSKVFK